MEEKLQKDLYEIKYDNAASVPIIIVSALSSVLILAFFALFLVIYYKKKLERKSNVKQITQISGDMISTPLTSTFKITKSNSNNVPKSPKIYDAEWIPISAYTQDAK